MSEPKKLTTEEALKGIIHDFRVSQTKTFLSEWVEEYEIARRDAEYERWAKARADSILSGRQKNT